MSPTLRAAIVALPLFAGGCADNPASYNAEGDSAMQTHQYGKASEAYGRSLEIAPGTPEVRAKYARALMADGRALDASEQFRIACNQRPDNEGWMDELCEALLAAGRKDDLFGLLRTNCSQRGRVVDYVRMGRFSQKMGDGDTARTALLTAARLDGGLTVAPQIALHDFYQFIGDRANAERRLRMAYFIDARSTEVTARIKQGGYVAGPTFGIVPVLEE